MDRSLLKVLLHVVFATKGRRPAIQRDLAGELQACLASACASLAARRIALVEPRTIYEHRAETPSHEEVRRMLQRYEAKGG